MKIMFKKILNYLTKTEERIDPTEGWESKNIETPHLDTATQKVGVLRYGDALERAKHYGKPDEIGWLEGDAFNLIYADKGFQLEFDDEKLSSVAYFVGSDEYNPKRPDLNYSKPVINTIALDSDSSSTYVQNNFGSPRETYDQIEEIILYYDLHKLIVEFEFSPSDKLKRVNIYPQ